MTEAQRIYKELKQDIVTCKLAPGLSISELEMSTRYEASRTPVREACRRLGDESLMRMIPLRRLRLRSIATCTSFSPWWNRPWLRWPLSEPPRSS